MSPLAPAVYLLAFAFALLVNGALLGLTQPVVLKWLMPRVAGTPLAWTTAAAFFVVVPVLGYAYAHGAVRMLGVRRLAPLHLLVLALPVAWWGLGLTGLGLPLPFDRREWALPQQGDQSGLALAVLLTTVGLPLFTLTAGVPLLLRWFAATGHPDSDDPYFLFGPGCLGNLAALLAYPVLIEPMFDVTEQGQWWQIGCLVSLVLTAGCIVLLWRSRSVFPPPRPRGQLTPVEEAIVEAVPAAEPRSQSAAEAVLQRLHWMALSAVPVALGSALTAYISVEVSAIPLFWMVPVVLAQLTLILAFARQPWFDRLPARAKRAVYLAQGLLLLGCLLGLALDGVFAGQAGRFTAALWLILAALVLLAGRPLAAVLQPLTALLLVFGVVTEIWVLPQLMLHLLAVFLAMRCCHSELARGRPPPDGLTGFFFSIAVGGALGGLFTVVVAPLLFDGIMEYWLALALACMLRPWSVRNGLSDLLLARGLCALWRCGATASRLARVVAAGTVDWLYPLLLGVMTVRLWIDHEQVAPLMASLGLDNPRTRDAIIRGVPLLFCLLVVGRRVRFGLSLGAVLVALSLAPQPSEETLVTLLSGIANADVGRVLLAMLLLPAALGTVMVLASLLSLLMTGGQPARMPPHMAPTPDP